MTVSSPRGNDAPWQYYAVVVLGLAGVFAIGSLVPLQVNPDLGFHIRAAETWLLGWSSSPWELALPRVGDLSADEAVWIVWWPPGATLLFLLQLVAGCGPATAVRIGAFACACLGGAGWVTLVARAGGSRVTTGATASLAVAHGAFGGGATTIVGADVLGYALMPWLMLNALAISDKGVRERPGSGLLLRALALGLGTGLLFWLKYSAFLGGSGVLAFFLFNLLFSRSTRTPRSRIAVGSAAVIPVLLLSGGLLVLNSTFGTAESTIGQAELVGGFGKEPLSLSVLAVEAAGAAGVAIFGANNWMTHLLEFSDLQGPIGEMIQTKLPSGLAKGILGLIGSGFVGWSLWRPEGLRRPARQLVALTYAFFLGGSVAASLALRYDLLAHEASRLAMFVLPVMQAVVVEHGVCLWRQAVGFSRRFVLVLLSVALAVAPVSFSLAVFVKLDVLARSSVVASQKCDEDFWLPELGNAAEFCLWKRIDEILATTSRGVVVLATNKGTSIRGSVGRRNRVLPFGEFIGPLAGGAGEAARPASEALLRTSRPLRVVLVVGAGEEEARLLARFPQAKAWQRESGPSPGAQGLWWADLRPDELDDRATPPFAPVRALEH